MDLQQAIAYTTAIIDARAELLLDGAYLPDVHTLRLLKPLISKKKNGLSHACLCYIVSHARAWSDLFSRTAILSCVQEIQDESRISLFRPFLTEALQSTQTNFLTATENVVDSYAQVLMEAFRHLPKTGLDNTALASFLEVLDSQDMDRKVA